MIRGIAHAAIVIAVTTQQAQAATPPGPCVTAAESLAMFTEMVPATLEAVQTSCASLPPEAFVHRGLPAMIDRYRALATDESFEIAVAAFAKLGGAKDIGMRSDTLKSARPLLRKLMSTAVTGNIRPASCGAIDRLLRHVDPLPPANTIGLFGAIFEITASAGDATKRSGFSLCPVDAADSE